MKRPEGFDRNPAPTPTPPAPEPEAEAPDEAVPGRTAAKSRAAGAGRALKAAGAAAASRATKSASPSSSPAKAPEKADAEPAANSESVDSARHPDPTFLVAPDTSAAEAKERARAARRLARRAAAERRAVERTEVRRFTRRTRHRRFAWITAGAVVVALVGAVTISVFSPLLSLQTITVDGTSRIDKTAIVKSLDDQIGKPLALVDFGAVKKDLSNFPLIESYVTETRPPHTLVIRITEREPIASVKVGKSFELVDPAGVAIESSPQKPKGVPLVDIRGGTSDGAVFRSAAEVLLSMPTALRATVSSVTASTPDDVTLTLTTGEQVVWGGADSSTRKAELLAGLIKDHKARNPGQAVEYDVSAPDNGIIRTK